MIKFNLLKMMIIVVLFQLLSFDLVAQNRKVFVASDLHYFDPDLIINDGSALESYLMMDRKMIRESAAIFEAMVDTILSIHPDLVFFTGDLTKDGELTSHQKFAGYCQILEDAGIEVLVIPGNHDINNPHAFAYDGANVIPVPGVSPVEFASIYENFGFGQAIAKDPNSLTYIVEPAPGLQIFAMDVCRYDDNYTLGHPVTAGSIPADSYSWIAGKLHEAKQNNKQVLGLMHHGLMEHYIGQKTLFSEYVIDGYDTLSVNFANMGMKAVFTGHYHAQDIVELTTAEGNTIYDIETGSSVTYPCPFRVIDIENNDLVNITSGVIDHINYDLGGVDFQTYAYNYIAAGLPLLVNYILTSPPYSLDPTSAGMITPVVTEAFIAHYHGNEGNPSPQSQAVINYLLSQPAYQMFGMMIMAIWNDPMPDDWTFGFEMFYEFALQTNPKVLYSSASGDIFKGGFGSGMFAAPGQDDTFYMITDRGPNADGPSIDVKIFPVPDFTPQVGIFKMVGNDLILQDSILLKRHDGTLLTGLPNPVGMGSTGETALDLNGNVLGTDPDGLDSESIAVCADGSFWVSDEYGPHIVHFDANGNTIERINPFGTGTGGRKLPAVLAKRRVNRGMEGLAITPDGKTLVGIMQSTMYNPTSTIAGKNVTRILTFNIETGATKQFIYLQEANGLSNCEISAIDNTTFLVIERDGLFPGDATPAVYKRVYKIYTDGATDVSDPENGEFGLMFQNGTKTIEQLTAAQLLAEGVVPVRKVLVADLLLDVPGYPHDKLEGVGIINDQLIAVSNDDDFAIVPDGNNGYAQKILPATGEIDRTTNYLLSLPQSLSSGYKGGNTAPVASLDIPDQSLSTGEVVILNLNDYFTDAEGNLLTYSAKLPNGTMVPEWIKYDQFAKTLTLCPVYQATLTVEVTATDLIDKTSQEFDINVVVANPMLTYLAGLKMGSWGKGAAEISAYDAGSQKLFVTNAELATLDIVDLSNPSQPEKVASIDISLFGAGLQSVAAYDGVVAVAVQADPATDPGSVVFFDTDGNFMSQVTVGSLPDMITFTHDGAKLLVANEGEPNTSYTIDPEGSISIIDMSVGALNLTNANVLTAGFTAFNGAVLDESIRIFGPNATVAQDLEPEYIAVSEDNTTAFVTLQEGNAFAIVDIASATVTGLKGMGFKNHNLPGNGLDASDRSAGVEIKQWPVYGMFLPDAVDSYTVNGNTYYVTVNEGDSRDYAGFSEEKRVKDLALDPVAFPNASYLKKNENLGRLKTTSANGDSNKDGKYEKIYCFGGRSFTVWDENGNMVFDSQDDFEQITAVLLSENFNSSHDLNNSFKQRSDDKGPEPEALKIAEIEGRYYAFIGLERDGGVMVYDVTNPNFPEFVEYRNDRNFSVAAEDDLTGHYGPEGILFIAASESPSGQPLVVVSHEISGSIAVYQVNAANATLPKMLTVLHNNDAESQLLESSYGPAYGGVANFKTKVDSLRNDAFNKNSKTIMLSSGDNFLAGPEFSASLNLPAGQPYYDAVAMDHIGYDAVAMGNHDFDFGPDILEKFIRDYSITQPTYLSANLDFSAEPGMLDLVNNGRIKKSTIVNLNGTYVGVVGLTTPMLSYISSPRNVIVNDDLVNIAQAEIDSLTNLGINKIILISHLQSIKEDSTLISQLRHVDIAIAGGGSELLTNDPSIALPGMTIYGEYPLQYNDADGEKVYVVTTPGEYTYVGHLMAEFDVDGKVISIDPESNPVLVTNATPDAALVNIVVEPVSEYIANLAQNIIATTEVTLDGVKNNIRTLETNEGDLVADALLWQATQLAPSFGVNAPDVAFQNGGGIRNNTFINAGSDISELTTFDILPFANFLAVVENVPPDQFKEILENAVSRVSFIDGRFAQVAGFEFTWDPAGISQIITNGEVTTPGTRVIEAKLADGTFLIQNGIVLQGAPAITVATLDFLAKGGDQYPFGDLEFTTLGITYQQALYNYITSSKQAVIAAENYPEGGNARILNTTQQNVNTPKGWSIISGYIEPDNNDIKEVVKKIANSGNLEIMIALNGFYWPSQNINTFTNGWTSQMGYKIKMNNGDNFILKGERTENKVIELVKGINYLPVPSTHPVDANAVFSQITDKLIFAFDIENYAIYWPDGGLYTLEQLVPGNGYIVSMSAPGSVDFTGFKSMAINENENLYQQISTSPWKTQLTGNYHLIAILNEAMSDFKQGDIIAIFKDDNTFAGEVLVEKNGENTCILAVGDDATTETTEGLLSGETMNFKVYRPSTEEIFDLEAEFSSTQPNADLFAENGASMIINFKATSVNNIAAAESFSIHPNPNTGIFNVLIKGFDEIIDLEVFNAQGQLILSKSMNTNINVVEFPIDLSTSPKGIYFVKANSRSNSWLQKVIIK